MRILQLNVWTGRIRGALDTFFKQNQFDVICLQEAVWSNKDELLRHFSVTVDEIKELTGLKYEARSSNWGLKFGGEGGIIEQGNVILSREEIVSEKAETVYDEYKVVETVKDLRNHCYTVQVAQLANGVTIVNHHGYWLPTPVGDETTTSVMQKVADIVREINGPLVMCGDLNVIHAAPAMRELDFLRDLTDEYKIDSTLAGVKFDKKVACDHILVNDGVVVRSFEVLDKLVSDHKALVAEIENA